MNENNIQNADNQTALYNLIQSIQTKIDSNQNENPKIENNITEKITNNNENIAKDTKDTKDTAQNLNIASLLNNFDISSFLNNFDFSKENYNNNNNNKEGSFDSSFNFNDIDPEALFKIQKIVSKMSKNNPKKDLLRSLKPFLRKSRQDKMGEYMTILSIIDAIDIFGSKGSD